MPVTVVQRRNPLETILPLVNTIGGLMGTFMQHKQNQALLEQAKIKAQEDKEKQAKQDATKSFELGWDFIKTTGGDTGMLSNLAKQIGVPLPQTQTTLPNSGYTPPPLESLTGIGQGLQTPTGKGFAPLTTMTYPILPKPMTPQETKALEVEQAKTMIPVEAQKAGEVKKAEVLVTPVTAHWKTYFDKKTKNTIDINVNDSKAKADAEKKGLVPYEAGLHGRVEKPKKQVERTVDLGNVKRIYYTDGTFEEVEKGVPPKKDSGWRTDTGAGKGYQWVNGILVPNK